jgi:hypothetical protein
LQGVQSGTPRKKPQKQNSIVIRAYLHEKTSAAAAPMNPKNGAISSPLKTAEEDISSPLFFSQQKLEMPLNNNPKLFQSTPKKILQSSTAVKKEATDDDKERSATKAKPKQNQDFAGQKCVCKGALQSSGKGSNYGDIGVHPPTDRPTGD